MMINKTAVSIFEKGVTVLKFLWKAEGLVLDGRFIYLTISENIYFYFLIESNDFSTTDQSIFVKNASIYPARAAPKSIKYACS